MPDVSHAGIRIDGVRLLVRDTGGDLPPVLLLHGLASSSRWWDLVARNLTGRFRVISCDMRGHGGSDRPAHGYTLDRLALDVDHLLKQLGTAPPLLVGHSLGAAVALRLASHNPTAGWGVVCVDGGVYDPKQMFGSTWDVARPKMGNARNGKVTVPVLRAWMQVSPFAAGSSPEEALAILLANYEEHAGQLRLRLAAEHELALTRSLWATDPKTLLAPISCPTRVLMASTGEREGDRVRARSAEAAKRILGDALHTEWIAGGHHLPMERPGEVAAAITRFLHERPRSL